MLLDIHLGTEREYTLTYELTDNSVSRYVWQCYNNWQQFDNIVSIIKEIHLI